MTFKSRSIAMLVVSVSLAACAGGTALSGKDKDRKRDDQTPTATGTDGRDLGRTEDSGDKAVPPVMITGTYLTCAEEPTTDAGFDVTYGCRLADSATGKTVALAAVASSFNWSFRLPEGQGVAARMDQPALTSAWQVLYRFTATRSAEAKAVATATRVILELTLLPALGGGAYTISNLLGVLIGAGSGGTSDIVIPVLPSGPNVPTPVVMPPAIATATSTATATGGPTETGTDVTVVATDTGTSTSTGRIATEGPGVEFTSTQAGVAHIWKMRLTDPQGVGEVTVTTGGEVEFTGAERAGSDALHTLSWRVPVTTVLRKNGKTCTGNGRLQSGMSVLVATLCQ